MTGDTPGEALTPEDHRMLVDAVNRFSDVMERHAEVASGGSSSGNRNVMRVEQGRDTLWLAVCATVLALAVSVNAQQRVSDLRADMTDQRIDMQTERVSRESTTRWTAQEVTAIRSYITTGKLAPMTAPPVAVPPPKKE